jgi:hypothetical protein
MQPKGANRQYISIIEDHKGHLIPNSQETEEGLNVGTLMNDTDLDNQHPGMFLIL